MTHGTSQPAEQPSLVTAYADANQTCRDIAQQVGIRNCDDSPEWRAAEADAEARHQEALAAGHSYDELSAANKARKANG